jgi:tetratricopeptide (TPR) repeat protein
VRPREQEGSAASVRQENEAARDVYAAGRDINISNYVQAPPPPAPNHTASVQVVTGEIPREPLSFVARSAQAELSRAAAGAAVAVVCPVTGLRGVGKTQLAAAYARARVRDGWGLVGWVNAESRDTLLAGLARIAEATGVGDPQGDSLESARKLKEHLQTRPDDSLLVFDNASDPDQLRPFLPAIGKTQVVVTTTDRGFTELGRPVEVPVFSRLESVDYLAERTGLADRAGAAAVAEELGDLPLGLAQAAAAIVRQHLTYTRYLERLRRVPVEALLGRIPGADYPRSTAAALLMSVDAAEASDPAGLTHRVLRVVAAMSPDGVHREILSGLPVNEAGSREEALDAAVERCTTGSLLTWSINGDSVIMHRLLGRVLRERDRAGGRWAETVAAALSLLEPRLVPAEQAWARREEGKHLAAQVEALWEADLHAGGSSPHLCLRMLRGRAWAALQLKAGRDLSGAIARGRKTLDDCRHFLGAEHPETLTLGTDLVPAFQLAGRLEEAAALAEQTLSGCKRALGTDHPQTLSARNALGAVYRSAGRLEEAVNLSKQTLADRKRVLGPDHPDTLQSGSDLGTAYRMAGRLAEATTLYEQTLADRKRVLGADHPRTLTSRNNLAFAYRVAGRLHEAVTLYEQTLADRERLLGTDHPETLVSRHNLGGAYHAAGRLEEAITLCEQTLADRKRVLGADNPATLLTRSILASAYKTAGRLEEAITLYEQTLADRERVLSTDHPQIFRSRHDLASACQAAGRLEEAITLYEQTLADRERVLGSGHRSTEVTRNSLASARAAWQSRPADSR